jgi:hypothetical protein
MSGSPAQRRAFLAHLRSIGICTRCQRAETQRFALCLKCRTGQAKAQKRRSRRFAERTREVA